MNFTNSLDIAHALKLPNADKINWTLNKSSSSDSASTQKRFNKLVEEKREEDNERFGPAGECPDVTELVENFCCMHLGVNLRKTFFESEESGTDDASSDVFIHEFCKLLSKSGGKHGIPEYGHGATAFPDFLMLMASQSKPSEATYYQQCGGRSNVPSCLLSFGDAGKIYTHEQALLGTSNIFIHGRA